MKLTVRPWNIIIVYHSHHCLPYDSHPDSFDDLLSLAIMSHVPASTFFHCLPKRLPPLTEAWWDSHSPQRGHECCQLKSARLLGANPSKPPWPTYPLNKNTYLIYIYLKPDFKLINSMSNYLYPIHTLHELKDSSRLKMEDRVDPTTPQQCHRILSLHQILYINSGTSSFDGHRPEL